MSRMVPTEETVIPDKEKSVFDWCKEGRADRLADLLSPQNINEKDEEVCTVGLLGSVLRAGQCTYM